VEGLKWVISDRKSNDRELYRVKYEGWKSEGLWGKSKEEVKLTSRFRLGEVLKERVR